MSNPAPVQTSPVWDELPPAVKQAIVRLLTELLLKAQQPQPQTVVRDVQP